MGELEDTRREIPLHFGDLILLIIEILFKFMFLDYQSLAVVILVGIFRFTLVAVME